MPGCVFNGSILSEYQKAGNQNDQGGLIITMPDNYLDYSEPIIRDLLLSVKHLSRLTKD